MNFFSSFPIGNKLNANITTPTIISAEITTKNLIKRSSGFILNTTQQLIIKFCQLSSCTQYQVFEHIKLISTKQDSQNCK